MAAAEPDLRLSSTPVVSVVGEAVVRAEPDEAMVLVTLSALEGAPGPALEDVARRSDTLIALLDELSIDRADRSTTGVRVREDFDHTPEGRRSLGHRAASTVAVRLIELAWIGQVVTRATTEFGARVDGPRWQIAAENPVRLEAARQAAGDGRRKAQAYAEGVGAELGALLRLSEPGSAVFARRGDHRLQPMSAAAGEMPVEPGGAGGRGGDRGDVRARVVNPVGGKWDSADLAPTRRELMLCRHPGRMAGSAALNSAGLQGELSRPSAGADLGSETA